MAELKKVEIIWLDAWSDEARLEVDALTNLTLTECHNTGYLIKGDEDKVIITQGTINNLFHGKTFVDGFVIIPQGMIKEIRMLDD
jgi:uncharacterized protein YacL